jgi:hypothetical protein
MDDLRKRFETMTRQGKGADGWDYDGRGFWRNGQKPGQYLDDNAMSSLRNKQQTAKTQMNAASYQPGVNYQSAITPYMSNPPQYQQVVSSFVNQPIQGGASSVSQANQYEDRLNRLLDNPNSIADTGAYKFRFNQGQQAIERSAAAKGMSGSGNVLAELANYGQGQASQAYDTEANRLAGLSGTEKQYILGKMGAANSEFSARSSDNLGRGTLALNASTQQGSQNALLGRLALDAGKAKADDYWNAQQMASRAADQNGYYKQSIW